MEEFYTGQISDELWKPIKGNSEYWISNYGRVFSFKLDRFLKPQKVWNQLRYNFDNKTSSSARKLVLDHYPKSEIVYDYGIPPKKVLIERIKSGKIGVYPNGNGWRLLIQKSNVQHCRTFETKEEARNHWLFMYCRVNGISYEETFEEVKNFGYKRIDLR